MVLTPRSREELSRSLEEAVQNRAEITRVDLAALNSLIEHKPEDMTATVEAGITLEGFQERLQRSGQWLPIDPAGAAGLTMGDLLACNWSGPRRFGYGTIRDYLLGIKVALANGEIIKAGGKVVKNVAGYDLCKLFIGARHSLGVIVEGTFKLRPLPESELVLESSFDSVASLDTAARALLESPVEPVILDAHNVQGRLTLVTGFAGAREDVEYQVGLAAKLGVWNESSTAYDVRFSEMVSVLPSKTADVLAQLNGRFVARFGNGIVYREGEAKRPVPNEALGQRVKNAYDPNGIFPNYGL